jgi:glycogen synthase
MKVLMTTDTVGGVWSYAVTLCRALERHGVDVVLATMGATLSPGQRDAVRSCRNVHVEESTYRLEWMADPWADVAAAAEWLLRIEGATRPDVIHLNGYAHAALPWSAPTLVVAHSCVLSWWHAVHGCEAPPEWDRYRSAVAAGIGAADMLVAPTRAALDAITADTGLPAQWRVLPNGCDNEALPLGTRDGFGRYARHRTLPAPVVLAAGRLWDEAKNLRTLSAAAPLMKWPLCVAGSDLHPSGERRPLHGVNHLGVLTPAAMRRWHDRASIFVHPALYEPFGLAPLEAALARTALVLGDIATLREVWGDAAVYVAPDDAAGIADAVNRLAGDPVRLAERAEAARRRARTMTARTMAAGYAAAYHELRAGSGAPDVERFACA